MTSDATLRDLLLDHLAIGEPPEDELRRTLPPCNARMGPFDVDWVLIRGATLQGSELHTVGSLMVAKFVPRCDHGEWSWELAEHIRVGAHRGRALITHHRDWTGDLPGAIAEDVVCSDEEQAESEAA